MSVWSDQAAGFQQVKFGNISYKIVILKKPGVKHVELHYLIKVELLVHLKIILKHMV